jgi:F0F1-type ATP synthase alpha subunit
LKKLELFGSWDGIARVSGLATVKIQELIEFENGAIGIAF